MPAKRGPRFGMNVRRPDSRPSKPESCPGVEYSETGDALFRFHGSVKSSPAEFHFTGPVIKLQRQPVFFFAVSNSRLQFKCSCFSGCGNTCAICITSYTCLRSRFVITKQEPGRAGET